ncbi:hypothetical protein A7M93_19355 [Acinetobacter baumannii]|nr:hypothetical protein A7M93_19355 [Acinetobacter baumannii]
MVRMGETGFMEWTEHKSLSITNKYIKFDNTISIFITIDVFALEYALIGVSVWIYFMSCEYSTKFLKQKITV